MTIIPRIAGAMQHVLATVGDTIARGTGFVKRKRKLSGAKFVQTLVFTWLAKPNASLEELIPSSVWNEPIFLFDVLEKCPDPSS